VEILEEKRVLQEDSSGEDPMAPRHKPPTEH